MNWVLPTGRTFTEKLPTIGRRTVGLPLRFEDIAFATALLSSCCTPHYRPYLYLPDNFTYQFYYLCARPTGPSSPSHYPILHPDMTYLPMPPTTPPLPAPIQPPPAPTPFTGLPRLVTTPTHWAWGPHPTCTVPPTTPSWVPTFPTTFPTHPTPAGLSRQICCWFGPIAVYGTLPVPP